MPLHKSSLRRPLNKNYDIPLWKFSSHENGTLRTLKCEEFCHGQIYNEVMDIVQINTHISNSIVVSP